MSDARFVSAGTSGGIYFVVPFPDGWEVCAFRFNHYPDVGHALTWELLVAPKLALCWSAHLYSVTALEQAPELIVRLNDTLAPLYDAVPRGRVVPPLIRQGKHRLYHGADLSPSMKITRSTIERSLGIAGTAVWLKDEHETRNTDSVEQFECLLRLE